VDLVSWGQKSLAGYAVKDSMVELAVRPRWSSDSRRHAVEQHRLEVHLRTKQKLVRALIVYQTARQHQSVVVVSCWVLRAWAKSDTPATFLYSQTRVLKLEQAHIGAHLAVEHYQGKLVT
jgi:hypothetical protein